MLEGALSCQAVEDSPNDVDCLSNDGKPCSNIDNRIMPHASHDRCERGPLESQKLLLRKVQDLKDCPSAPEHEHYDILL